MREGALTFGSLFAGIGGMDLGLERAGMRCVWQVEIDPFCRRVLAKHWPDVRRHDDVRTFPPGDGSEWRCDVIAGGFPCQDISGGGRKEGIGGERSGLWQDFARTIRHLRPRHVIVENVAAILSRGLDTVLGDLAGMGYGAWWCCIPSAALGVPQRRPRVLVAADADGRGFQGCEEWDSKHADAERRRHLDGLALAERAAAGASARVRRMDCRVPRGVDRLRIAACGNSIAPPVAEWIGRRIIEASRKGGHP
jgi:DNA (cytosine-5)-methyltransferase 1